MLTNHLFLIPMSQFIGSSHARFLCIAICNILLVTGNSLQTKNLFSEKDVDPLPIDTIFKLPSPLPTWPAGGNFATGVIDLGGLKVRQITSFDKIWATRGGGGDNHGVTFFEPSSIPEGFSMLGSYAQANNRPLFGWVLVGKTDASDESGDILKQPTDYTLVWPDSTGNHNSSQDSAYIWLPAPPDGYKAVGLVATNSSDKPSVDKVRCVRSDFTDELETDNWIWGANGVNVYGTRTKTRGRKAQPLSAGTFVIRKSANNENNTLLLSCLKNKNSNLSSTPNLSQIEALFQTYSPYIYFHSKENFLPSSVNWFFSNGALLYKAGEEFNPIAIQTNGSNLPQGGSDDGLYWLDLPADEQAKERVKRGDLESAEAYIHVKPILGATFTDIQVWLFYPFNGPATAKLGVIEQVPLGKIGDHVGDWEHVTLRISNFDGSLYRVYFAEHSGGTWIDASLLEFQKGNKFVGYSSRNGHATFYHAGLVLQGGDDVGIRNDMEKSEKVMDTGAKFIVVAAEGLSVVEPPWLNYYRKWGPKIDYDLADQLKKVEKLLPGFLKPKFNKFVNSLPKEVLGEDGPQSPKVRSSWDGQE